MYEDKTLVCRDCGNEFVFSASEQAFSLKKDSRMSPAAARHAVLRAVLRMAMAMLPARCMK